MSSKAKPNKIMTMPAWLTVDEDKAAAVVQRCADGDSTFNPPEHVVAMVRHEEEGITLWVSVDPSKNGNGGACSFNNTPPRIQALAELCEAVVDGMLGDGDLTAVVCISNTEVLRGLGHLLEFARRTSGQVPSRN